MTVSGGAPAAPQYLLNSSADICRFRQANVPAAPLGPIAKTIAAVEALDLEDGAHEKIMHQNAERLMKMAF